MSRNWLWEATERPKPEVLAVWRGSSGLKGDPASWSPIRRTPRREWRPSRRPSDRWRLAAPMGADTAARSSWRPGTAARTSRSRCRPRRAWLAPTAGRCSAPVAKCSRLAAAPAPSGTRSSDWSPGRPRTAGRPSRRQSAPKRARRPRCSRAVSSHRSRPSRPPDRRGPRGVPGAVVRSRRAPGPPRATLSVSSSSLSPCSSPASGLLARRVALSQAIELVGVLFQMADHELVDDALHRHHAARLVQPAPLPDVGAARLQEPPQVHNGGPQTVHVGRRHIVAMLLDRRDAVAVRLHAPEGDGLGRPGSRELLRLTVPVVKDLRQV